MDARFAFEVGSTLCFQTSIVIAVTFAMQRWVEDARWGCRLWATCFVSLLVLVVAAFLLPHRRLFNFPGELSRETMLCVVAWQSRITIALAVAWASGVAWSLLRRILLCFRLLRFLQKDCDAADTAILLGRVGISADDQPTLSIRTSRNIQGPFCWQLHRPIIVLPTFLVEHPEGEDATLRHVLLHELEHLRTQHPMQHFLQGVCSTAFWFHPLVWSAARGAELTREYLCDEVAARTIGKFSAYLRTLAKVAEQCGSVTCTNVPASAKVPKGTLAFGNQPSTLIRRSNRLVLLAEGETGVSRWRPIVAFATMLFCAVAVQQLWLPTNVMASQRSAWSPWPKWTASALHQIDIQVRDFEVFEDRVQMHELLYEED